MAKWIMPWNMKHHYVRFLMNKSRQEWIDSFVNDIRPAQDMPQWGAAEADELPCNGKRMTVRMRDGKDIRVILYTPKRAKKNAPALFQIHGGHFYSGYAETDDDTCLRLSEGAGIRVISIGYRLAPEYPYPCAVNDCYDVIKYFKKHAKEYGLDPDRFGISGECAGGAIAAAVAFRAAEKKDFRLRYLQMMTPSLDRVPENVPGDAPAIVEKYMRITNCYCDPVKEAKLPEVSPVYATEKQFESLPPLVMALAEMDYELESGIDFAIEAQRNGVEVTVKTFPEAPHNFTLNYPKTWREKTSESAFSFLLNGIRQYLNTGS